MTGGDSNDDSERLRLVERTHSDDEQNRSIPMYATPGGTRYPRKERALTSFDDDRERYAAEARRMAEVHDPDDEL